MNKSNDKMQRLIEVARLYYEQDKTQSDIAKRLGVSRPLISRMLAKAREYGIVHIEIRSPIESNSLLIGQLRNITNIRGGVAVPDAADDNITNTSLAAALLAYLEGLDGSRYGIGWGTLVGSLVSVLENQEADNSFIKTICPLVGNSSVSNRNYHSNEIVRIIAQQTYAAPIYLYAPAFVETEQELHLLRSLENYKSVKNAWSRLDTAIVNIGNFPSSPDFASGARYGDLLTRQKAVGRLLAYYFDQNGQIIHSDTDYAVQIPVETLARCAHVIGVCSASTSPKAVIGALRTGLINHIALPESVAKAAIEYKA